MTQQSPVAGSFQYGNEHSGDKCGEQLLDQMSVYYLIKKYTVP